MDDHDQLKFFFFFILFYFLVSFPIQRKAWERENTHYTVCYAKQNGTQETGNRIFTAHLRLSCFT